MTAQGRALTEFRLIRVAAARHVRGHVLWLRFDDTEFAQVRVEDGIVTWPSGADWATESLYERLPANRPTPHSRRDVPATPAAILSFPGRALRLVLEWRELHQDQLSANWDRLRAGESPQPIDPLS